MGFDLSRVHRLSLSRYMQVSGQVLTPTIFHLWISLEDRSHFEMCTPERGFSLVGFHSKFLRGCHFLKDSKKHWFVVYCVVGRRIYKQLALTELRG